MNDDFDIILGCDCTTDNVCNLLFSQDCAKISCAAHDGNCYAWPVSAAGQDRSVKCSLIDGRDFDKQLSWQAGRRWSASCMGFLLLSVSSRYVLRQERTLCNSPPQALLPLSGKWHKTKLNTR